jgi:quercetin 2,3-dioxygenase
MNVESNVHSLMSAKHDGAAQAHIDVRRFETLGRANHGWLDARHHFSFSEYYDSARMGWGSIRVWNDDRIAPQSGFPPHGHADMEIITYVRSGAITHEDSLGNKGRTEAGDVQVMSAGTGVRHSEYNLENEETTLFQIWIEPRNSGGAAGWDAKPFPKSDRTGGLQLLASGFGEPNALVIRADARMFGATLAPGQSINHRVDIGRHAYLVPALGTVAINGIVVNARDGVALSGGDYVIMASEQAEIVLVDAA